MTQLLQLEWEVRLGTPKMDMFIDVIEDINGGFTVLGSTQLKNKSDLDFWLVRFNVKGDTLWTKVVGTQNHDYPTSMLQLADGSYILTGKTETESNSTRAFILKIDSNTNVLWQKNIGNDDYLSAENVISTGDNEIIVSGIRRNNSDIENVWVAKLNADGNVLWEKLIEDSNLSCSQSLKQLPDGGFVLAGSVKEKDIPDADLMVIRFSEGGEEVWKYKSQSTGINVWPECICCSPDSNFIVVGWHGACMNDISSENPVFDYDLFISKISPKESLLQSTLPVSRL